MIEVSRFWRDPTLPFVEARRVGDGRQVCYAAHSIGPVVRLQTTK